VRGAAQTQRRSWRASAGQRELYHAASAASLIHTDTESSGCGAAAIGKNP